MKRLNLLALIVLVLVSSCKKDEPKEPPVNYKQIYTISDYYRWDAYASYDKDSTGWGPNSSGQNIGKNVIASQSCKDCPTYDKMCMYLAAGVYYDTTSIPSFTLPGGTTSGKGLWIKKRAKVANFGDTKNAKMVSYISLKNNPDLFHQGRPENTSDYFFVPALGYYTLSELKYAGVYGYYWLSSSLSSNGYYLLFSSTYAKVSSNYRWSGQPRLVGE